MTSTPPPDENGAHRQRLVESDGRVARLSIASCIAFAGLASAAVEVGYAMRVETLVARVFEAAVPLAVAIGLVASAILLALSDLPRRATLRLAGWFAGGVLGFAGVAGWLFAHELIHGAHLHHWPYLLVSTATVGGFVGFTIGWYDARAWMDRVALEAEQRAVERERTRMAFLNRLLRHHVLNGMNVIKGNADRLTGSVDDDAEPHLETVRSRSDEVAGLVHRVRSLTDVISDGGTMAEPRALEGAVQSAVAATVPDDVPVECDVPAASIRGDDRLTTALESLLSAAVRTGDGGPLRVSADAGDGTAVLRVRTGGSSVGRDAADWETVDPTDGSTDVDVAIADAVAPAYGGTLSIEEGPDGVAFVVELPLAE